MSNDLSFAFGKNWASYATKISDEHIAEATRSLSRLLGGQRLDGQSFLDIGCGSGLHSVAALRLGAHKILAIDVDPDSVATTHSVLERFAYGQNWSVKQKSIFELASNDVGQWDVVYSWGVLHHTGNMRHALRCAANVVAPHGCFIFALYRRTWMDWFWKREKRWYAHASPQAQSRARKLYVAMFKVGLFATGRQFASYVENYRTNRGMDFDHDVHDWLGGWPYETISNVEVKDFMEELGFVPERIFSREGRILGRDLGLFGSGNDEYVFRRRGRDAGLKQL